MIDKLNFGRTFRGAAWAIAGVCCLGLLSLGTTNCLPTPADDTTGSGGGSGSGFVFQEIGCGTKICGSSVKICTFRIGVTVIIPREASPPKFRQTHGE